MLLHDDAIRMRHMLDHATDAVQFGGGKSSREIADDRILNLAIARLLEIIGEAASRVSSETRATNSDIPWGEAINLRDHLIQGNGTFDVKVVQQIIADDLPPLIEQLSAILTDENHSASRAATPQS